MRRRDALKLGLGAGATAAAAAASPLGGFWTRHDPSPPLVARRRIAPLDVELAPGIKVRSIAFGGTIPGAPLRRGSGTAAVEFYNDSDADTVVHSNAFADPLVTLRSHGGAQALLRTADETGTGAGLRSYRAYCAASGGIAMGTFVAGAGSVTDADAAAFHHTEVLTIHRWQPRPVSTTGHFDDATVGYAYASFNDRLLSASEPIRVRRGDRVRFHFSNASTLRDVTLGLPQHRFLVVALDGRNVPTPRHVERLYLGPAESVDAVVTMDRPGRWILGATHRGDRAAGLGRLVEYAGVTGPPRDSAYGIADWDYCTFGAAPVGTRPMRLRRAVTLPSLQLVRRVAATERELCDPTPQAMPMRVSAGGRYRVSATNLTREPQSLEVLNHDLELVRFAGRQIAGLIKEVVTLPALTRVEFEFEARTDQVFLAHRRQVSLVQVASRA